MNKQNIVFSGFTDEILRDKIKSQGFNLSDITNNNTFCVIVNDPDKPFTTSSSKVKIALQSKIPIIDKFSFTNYISENNNIRTINTDIPIIT
jgi:hypothetical protein